MSTQRSVRFPDDVFAALVAEAERTDRSFSYVVAKTCGERFVLRANPFSVADRSEARAEREVLEKALTEGLSTGEAVPDPGPSASPRAPGAIPGVVRASSLAKAGVKPIPKKS